MKVIIEFACKRQHKQNSLNDKLKKNPSCLAMLLLALAKGTAARTRVLADRTIPTAKLS